MREIQECWAADKNPKYIRGMANSEARKRKVEKQVQARDQLNALSFVISDPTTPAILRERGLEMFRAALDARRGARRIG